MLSLLISCLLGSVLATAAIADSNSSDTPSLPFATANKAPLPAAAWSLNIDASFTYYDQVKSLQAENPARVQALQAVSQGEVRTIGLRKLAVNTSWMPVPAIKFSMTLRPDASIREKKETTSITRELDTRAGETLQDMPEVKLLDAYNLIYGQPERSQFSIGAFPSLFEPQVAFSPIMEFGLIQLLPHKFLGVSASWNHLLQPDISSSSGFRSYIKPQIFVFEGTDDKGEQIRREEGKYDESLMAKDPQRGFGLSLEYGSVNSSQIALVGAYEEQGLQFGKEKRTYAGLFFYQALPSLLAGLNLSGDYRYLQNATQGALEQRATVNQHSAQILALQKFSSEHAVGGRVSYGLGQRADVGKPSSTISIRGYSWDFVYQHAPLPGTEILFQISEEMRENMLDGKTADGFISGTEATKRIHRIGVELRQHINGSNIL